MKPTVSGVPIRPSMMHSLESPHVELLARLAVGGGTLTTLETREVCAAIVAHLDARDVEARDVGAPHALPIAAASQKT